jgi:formyltetrahydrofolate-dependent phosphoribosylglycinamide formyltransferase
MKMKSFLRFLRARWNVGAQDLLFIIIVFALAGFTTALLTRSITGWLQLESDTIVYWVMKLLVLFFGYQLIILLWALPFGQFVFFLKYEQRIWGKLFKWKGKSPKVLALPPMKSIAIFASGAGSNAQEIIRYFNAHHSIRVSLVVTNKPEAGVVDVASTAGIPVLTIEKERFFRGDGYVPELHSAGIDFIVLAGFLWKVPDTLVEAYRNRMINIHPALLPAYGGKGMYGSRVHEAVIAAGEKQSGISIHFVDEVFDHGKVIFQASCDVLPNDSPSTLAERIHGLEHANYPRVIEELLDPKSTLNPAVTKA